MRARDVGRHSEPIVLPVEAAYSAADARRSLGQRFVDARARRGLTTEQAAHDAHVMVSYLKMIECGDYSAIPDMLYLLPFFQRYAAFLGLDVKDVTARFVRDFEAEENAPTLQAPSALLPNVLAELKALPWQRIAQAGGVAAILVLLAGIAFAITRAASQRTVEISPKALTSLPPPVRVNLAATPAAVPSPGVAQPPVAASAPIAAAAEPTRAATMAHHHATRHASVLHRHRRHHHGPG